MTRALLLAAFCCALLLNLSACRSSTQAETASAPPAPEPPPENPAVPELGPLISGMSSWVDGVYVWTDYAYDDHGANTDGRPGGDGDGGYTAETANTADFIQVQLGLDADGWFLRSILETLVDAQRPVTGYAFDTDANPQTGASNIPGGSWPAATPLGVELLLVQRGDIVTVAAYENGAWKQITTLPAAIDLQRNSIEIAVPAAIADPRGRSWRAFAMAGFVDPASGDSWPEGGAIMDLAFVGNERPYVHQTAKQGDVLGGTMPADEAAALIDFTLAEQGHTQLAQAPPGRFSTFLHHSRLITPEGIVGKSGLFAGQEYLGPYQPYLVWLPNHALAAEPLLVYLHGSNQNHLGDTWVKVGGWPYHGLSPGLVAGYAGNNKPVGTDPEDVYLPNDGAVGSIVHLSRIFAPYDAPGVAIFPLGRMNSSGYTGLFEEEVLEAIADVRARLPIDGDRISTSGSSMGGIGTFRLAALYPDLFAHAFAMIGDGEANPDELENMINLPVRQQNGVLDPLIRQPAPSDTADRVAALDVDFRYYLMQRREHESVFAINHCLRSEGFAAVRNARPARVVYHTRQELIDVSETGYSHRYDKAYWVSGIRLREATPAGSVRITDLSRADRERAREPIDQQLNNLAEGRDLCGPNPAVRTLDIWNERGTRLSAGAAQPSSNALDAQLRGIGSVTVDLRQTGVTLASPIDLAIDSDGAASLQLAGAWSGPVQLVVRDARSTLNPSGDLVTVPVTQGRADVQLLPTASQTR